jgi:hypothetical protein
MGPKMKKITESVAKVTEMSSNCIPYIQETKRKTEHEDVLNRDMGDMN